jgi:hypothetical protein
MSEDEKTRRLEEAQKLIGDVLEGQHAARNRIVIARRHLDAWLVGDVATPFDELLDAEGEASRAG